MFASTSGQPSLATTRHYFTQGCIGVRLSGPVVSWVRHSPYLLFGLSMCPMLSMLWSYTFPKSMFYSLMLLFTFATLGLHSVLFTNGYKSPFSSTIPFPIFIKNYFDESEKKQKTNAEPICNQYTRFECVCKTIH